MNYALPHPCLVLYNHIRDGGGAEDYKYQYARCYRLDGRVGSVGIKNTRYAISAGLIAEFAGILASIAVAYVFFG